MTDRDTALVTGGAGFLGSHICDRLLELGFDVLCIDNLMTGQVRNIPKGVRFVNADVVNMDVSTLIGLVPRIAFSGEHGVKLKYVFNFACPASPPKYQDDPIHTMMTSVIGTRNFLSLARVTNATFIQASTSEVYGDPSVSPQNESYRGNVNTCGPRACYDEGKRAAESLCYDYRRVYGTDTRVVRIFNTYGPRMDANDGRVVSNFINQSLVGKEITVYGDGKQTRSFCYVDDLVDGIMALATIKERPDTPINIGNPNEMTMLQLVSDVIKCVHGDSTEHGTLPEHWATFLPLPEDDPTQRCPDITLAKKLLGWQPKVSHSDGLAMTVNYFKQLLEEKKKGTK